MLALTKKIIFGFILVGAFGLFSVSHAQIAKYYQIDLNWTEAGLSVADITVIPTAAPQSFAHEALHQARLINFSDLLLETTYFSPTYEIIVEGDEEGEGYIETIEPELVTVRVPYHDDGKSVAIYNPEGRQLISVDVGYLSEASLQRLGETRQPGDSNQVPPLETVPTSPQAIPSTFYVIMAVGILIILGIIIYMVVKYRRAKKAMQVTNSGVDKDQDNNQVE